jgi:hypothetical protein
MLFEDIVIEALKMYGQDVVYLPREVEISDEVLNEEFAGFRASYMVEMYIANTEGFEGDGNLLSKFGLEICVDVPEFSENGALTVPQEIRHSLQKLLSWSNPIQCRCKRCRVLQRAVYLRYLRTRTLYSYEEIEYHKRDPVIREWSFGDLNCPSKNIHNQLD